MNQVTSNTYSKTSRHMAIIVTILIFLPSFNFFLNNILLSSGFFSVGTVLYLFLLVVELYGLNKAFRSHLVGKYSGSLSFFVATMSIVSYFLYMDELGSRFVRPDYHIYYSELLFLFFFGLPAMLLSSACRCWDLVLNYSTKVAPVIVVMTIYAWWRVGFSTWGDESINYMTLSYHVLPAGCFCISKAVKGLHPFYWFTSLIFLFIIFAAGCRGALVCSTLFLALIIIHQATYSANAKTARRWRLIGLLILLALPLYFSQIFDAIGMSISKLGIMSRSMEMMTDNTFFQDGARNTIQTAIWRGVEENPMGYGLYGDRYICSKYYQGGAEYAHNIFYEFIADYGLLFGILLLLLIIVSIIKLYWKQKKSELSVMLLLLLPDGFIKLFFSNSYLMDTSFFILMGFLIVISTKKRYKNNIQ